MTSETGLPLDGVKVVDLTAIVLGPLATLMLADLGADVIKIEPPEGDSIRHAGLSRSAGMGSIFITLNRNKRSVVLDLKDPASRPALIKLVAQADVVVHNMRPNAARKLGLGYEVLSEVNPTLIYCSASGFDLGSDRAADPAVDDVIQAASGLASLFEQNSSEPRYVPSLLADKISGLYLSHAILAALIDRQKTGRGRSINIAMAETMAAFTLIEHLGGSAFSPAVGPVTYGRLTTPYRKPMKTADGFIAFTPYSKQQWQAFFVAAGRPDLGEDPRIVDPARRNAEIGDLYALLGEILVTNSSSHWMAIARKNGIPASPVLTIDALVASEDLRRTGHIIDLEGTSEGTVASIHPWGNLFGTKVARPAPSLGRDTEDVLREL
ncbi:MAG TPA: CoA transferase [Tianweitania sediminis]|jgi:formyl-CoA transferase|nr:CoA transferase [Tianweitania sediminis]